MIPHRTVARDRSPHGDVLLQQCKRSLTFGALALVALLFLTNLMGATGHNLIVDKMADTPSSEEPTADGEQLMPQRTSGIGASSSVGEFAQKGATSNPRTWGAGGYTSGRTTAR
uniref:Uncharacterized protein n=1 Tax=Anopheles culicifacies TaxID=139723 RepID=A0A182LV75_9DIPT